MARPKSNGFHDRIARINKGGANTMGEVHIGPSTEERATKGRRKSKPAANTVRMKRKTKKVRVGEGSGSGLVMMALILGAFSMFVGQAAAFHLFGEGGLVNITLPWPTLEPYLPFAHIAFGGTLAFLFAWTFRLFSFMRTIALVAGCSAMVVYHTQLVTSVPGLYVSFFTKEYVKEILAAV